MVDDELTPHDEADSAVQPGARRSTFTPPPEPPASSSLSELTDDDALAGALSQEYQRWAPVTSPVETRVDEQAAQPEPQAPPQPEPAHEQQPGMRLQSEGSIPPPPKRESLTDEQLLAAADLDSPEHDTSALLALMEAQLLLRQSEVERLTEWENQVRETVGPEAEMLVAQVRSAFTGVVPVVAPMPAPEPAAEPAQEQPAPPPTPPPTSPPTRPALALADAPPPYGAAVTEVPPPPGSVPPAEIPQPPPALVEPAAPLTGEILASGALSFDALLAGPETSTGEVRQVTDDGAEGVVPGPVFPRVEEPLESPTFAPATMEDIGLVPTDLDPPDTDPADKEQAVAAPLSARVPVVERTGLGPTPDEQRTGRSIRQFWLWFAVNASVVSLSLGAVLLGLGMSLRQAILSALIGVALSFLPLGLGTLASKWSGQPTMVLSRATFGMVGNLIPVVLAVVTRIVWAAALLWILGVGVAEVLIGSGVVSGIAQGDLALAIAGAGLVIAAVLAGLGFRAISITAAIVSVLSAIVVAGVIVLTLPYVDFSVAISVADGDWMLLVTGAVLVFSVVGLAWANSGGDLARYQRANSIGPAAALWTGLGATLPPFLLISWGALLAASNPFIAEGLVANPVDIISRMLPLWYPAPLALAVGLSLVAGATLALYSGGFALLATGMRTSRTVSVVIAVFLAGAAAAGLALLVPDLSALFRDIVTTLAVPVAAWAGIFGAETMIRTQRVHAPSILQSGGVYPAVRWTNTVLLLVIAAVGWGLTTASITGLQWQGYLWGVLGMPVETGLGATDVGVVVALVLGLLTPLVAGIPALRRLHTAERAASGEQNDPPTGPSPIEPTAPPASQPAPTLT